VRPREFRTVRAVGVAARDERSERGRRVLVAGGGVRLAAAAAAPRRPALVVTLDVVAGLVAHGALARSPRCDVSTSVHDGEWVRGVWSSSDAVALHALHVVVAVRVCVGVSVAVWVRRLRGATEMR
jgi:hypothetical protein